MGVKEFVNFCMEVIGSVSTIGFWIFMCIFIYKSS